VLLRSPRRRRRVAPGRCGGEAAAAAFGRAHGRQARGSCSAHWQLVSKVTPMTQKFDNRFFGADLSLKKRSFNEFLLLVKVTS